MIMKKLWYSLIVWSMSGAFLVGALLCCCARQLVAEQTTAKAGCCHKTAKADPVKCTDGCSSFFKSAEKAKVFDLAPSSGVHMPLAMGPSFSVKPVHTIKPVFLNGPPGPVTMVPLYTQFHSLRV